MFTIRAPAVACQACHCHVCVAPPKLPHFPDEYNCGGSCLMGTDHPTQDFRVEQLGECRGVGEVCKREGNAAYRVLQPTGTARLTMRSACAGAKRRCSGLKPELRRHSTLRSWLGFRLFSLVVQPQAVRPLRGRDRVGRRFRVASRRRCGLFYQADFVRCQSIESIDVLVYLMLQRTRVR